MCAMNNPREFTLKFKKRTYDWFVMTQPATPTEDQYETRVIEYYAYADAMDTIRKLEEENKELREVVNHLSESMAAISDLAGHMKLASILFSLKSSVNISIPKQGGD